LSEAGRIVEVAELDLVVETERWPFSDTHAAEVAAHWARLVQEKPALYNGRILLMGRRKLERRSDREWRLRGAYFETGYADFIAWDALGHPGEPVHNCFSMAALQSAEGAFLLGEMAPHTFNGGQIYFPAGTPDPSDVFEGKVDLDFSARRELLEETGIKADEVAIGRGWTLVFSGERIGCMKPMRLDVPADEAKDQIDAFLALDPHAEFSRMHIVRRAADIDEARTPPFVTAYLRHALSTR
jgi:8-oxo-dGTP pyrophosphatase MutT (NUDIX family)